MVGAVKSEIPDHHYIQRVVIVSGKNYGYDLGVVGSNDVAKQVIKTRGFSQSSDQARSKLNTEMLAQFIDALKEGETMALKIPQMSIRVNNKKKTLHSKELLKLYSNVANSKRYYKPAVHPSKTWAYGTVQYE